MSKIMLCADSVSVRYPECLGLAGEALHSQDWLELLTSAHEARIRVREEAPEEVWVAGSDEVDAINLAAALKSDGSPSRICLLASEAGGSLRSRAQAAGIDEVWDHQAFLQHYRQAKTATPSAPGPSRILVPSVISDEAPKAPAHAGSPGKAAPARTREQADALDVSPRKALSVSERGYLLTVLGAGGGVGKSSVAVVAAYIAQSQGYRTALVDADLQFGDVQYLTGRDDALSIDEALSTPARLDALECRGRQPAVLAAPAQLERSEEVAAQVPALVESLRSRFDVVVVNTSPAWAEMHLQLIEAGGNALFVLDQRPSSIRSCKHALQLCARCGVATQAIVFALNRCSRQSLFSSIDVTCALQGAHVVELSDGGRDVEELLGTGAPVELVDSGNALCQSLARALADLLPKQHETPAPTIRMPSRRRGWFGSRRKKAACL